ncbi:MAG: adenosylcobinamide-phosphate synthase CbiB [bacterium]|nr:adenosylcobinamide-phosphate synthase CbiB [bacterium]
MIKELLLCQTIALVIGYILDLIFGDPRYSFHPIRLIGLLIGKSEKMLRKVFSKSKNGELAAGTVLFLVVIIIATGLPAIILIISYRTSIWLGLAIESIFCYQLIATKCLKDESMKVYYSLKKRDIEEARYNVSMIVGRDTKVLDQEGITKATVETIAENASDGVIAPIFYMMIGGAVLGFLYKSINTLDSMVGYKNEKYLYLGRCSAKMDDIVNYVPSRSAGLLMVGSSYCIGLDGKQAYKIFRRDSRNHASPNSAQTEAACAGALNIQLAGDAYYFGKLYKKPYIGDKQRAIEVEDIKRANQLLYGTALLMMVMALSIRLIFIIS